MWKISNRIKSRTYKIAGIWIAAITQRLKMLCNKHPSSVIGALSSW